MLLRVTGGPLLLLLHLLLLAPLPAAGARCEDGDDTCTAERRAFVTLDAVGGRGRHYWRGVVTMAQSLRDAGMAEDIDIVCLTLDKSKIDPRATEAYGRLGVKVHEIEPVPIPDYVSGSSAWHLPWHKLAVWTLTEYDKVVYMDADSFILENMDELFTILDDGAALAASGFACAACARMRPDTPYPDWTSGLFVMRPSLATYYAIVEAANQPSAWGSATEVATPGNGKASDGKFRNDQRFLMEFYGRGALGGNSSLVWIDHEVYHSNPTSCWGCRRHKGPWIAKRVDFGCVTKPWRWYPRYFADLNKKRAKEGKKFMRKPPSCYAKFMKRWWRTYHKGMGLGEDQPIQAVGQPGVE